MPEADVLVPYTRDEMRDMFMDHCRSLVDYWANPKIAEGYDTHNRLSGLLHSILAAIDGSAGGFPCSLDLVCRPHPDDKQYHQDEGEPWVEDGTIINEQELLHELLYAGEWR